MYNKYKKPVLGLAVSLIIASFYGCNNQGSDGINKKNENMNLKYESPEHRYLGAGVELSIPQEDGSVKIFKGNEIDLLNVQSNGKELGLPFSDIIYLAGDFIGDPDIQIGGKDLETNMNNFKKNFKWLSTPPAVDYIPKIKEIVDAQFNDNKDNILDGKALDLEDLDNVKFNCATGGGCTKLTFLVNFGLYMKLATKNYDHFSGSAIDTYNAGHRLALETAINAKSIDDLKLAYAYDAYGDHFLTDLFASGHVRVPRKEILDRCTYTPNNAASYLTKVMHDRDGSTGLWFTSKDGNRWFGYGDAQFFIKDNIKNETMVSSTLQSSVNQIFVAYNHRALDQTAKSAIIDSMMEEINQKLPDLDKIADDPENKPAIFKIVNKEVLTYDANAKKYVHLNCWKVLSNHAIWGL